MPQSKKDRGRKIQTLFKQCAEQEGLFVIRLKDSASSWQGGNARFTPDNPCDYIIFESPCLFSLELKSTVGSSFSIQLTPDDNNAMIKAHQIKSLIEMSQHKNSICGFVFDMYSEKNDEERMWFLSIENFSNFVAATNKKSINASDIVNYGGIEIEVVRKRVWSSFKIKPLIDKLISKSVKGGT